MKKILIGLFAMSVASFSTLDLNGQATTETNLWETGQEGRIPLKGNFVTTPSEVKYVIFTSPDGTLTGAEDTLNLPKIILSQNYNIPTIKGTPQKVYVKKLVDGATTELTNESVTFTFGLDSFYTDLLRKSVANGKQTDMPATAFLSKQLLQELTVAAFSSTPELSSPEVSTYGEPLVSVNGEVKTYRAARQFYFAQNTLGVLEIFTSDHYSANASDTLAKEYAVLFENQLTTERTGTFTIKAEVSIPQN